MPGSHSTLNTVVLGEGVSKYLMLLGGLVALWPTHNTTSHIRVRSFRPHQRPPRPGRSRAEHASASRPSQQPIRPSRARAPAELRFAASNIVQSYRSACQPKTDTSRTLPAHSTTISTNFSAWGPSSSISRCGARGYSFIWHVKA